MSIVFYPFQFHFKVYKIECYFYQSLTKDRKKIIAPFNYSNFENPGKIAFIIVRLFSVQPNKRFSMLISTIQSRVCQQWGEKILK